MKNRSFIKRLLPFILGFAFAMPVFADNASTSSKVYLTDSMTYAANSKIHSDPATLYTNTGSNANGITVCVNAGHGTSGGESERTLCHPDGSPKVTGGTTAAGATTAIAISSGMTFNDGTAEATVTLAEAVVLKDLLIEKGYNVLMIRENNNTQLDNVARTVLANAYADCHVAIHWDSTSTNKGAFYCKVPSNAGYKAMEPVASTWQKSDSFGECLITGLKNNGTNIFGSGSMELDLTQTSYSTVPSIDIECGDAASDHSQAALEKLAAGLAEGIDLYFADRLASPVAPPAEPGRVNVTIGKKIVTVSGSAFEIDTAPYIQPSTNSTLVPLRFAAIAICGGDVENADTSENVIWDDPTRTATVKTDDSIIVFTADSDTMTVNGVETKMANGAIAEIKNGRMFIPFRALGEALNVDVEWDKATSTASYKMR